MATSEACMRLAMRPKALLGYLCRPPAMAPRKMAFPFVSSGRMCSSCDASAMRAAAGSGNAATSTADGRPPSIELLFLNPTVQRLLSKMTGMDPERVFRPLKTRIQAPRYKFLTDEQVQKLQRKAHLEAVRKLQMPPVMQERKPIEGVVSKDPELQGFLQSKYLFIDLSRNPSHRERIIVARDPDGTLRQASWEERHYMNQMFFPIPGRKLKTPKLFEPQNLKHLLDRREYEFLLEFACVQFDPDDPEYIRVTREVYEHIRKEKQFDVLRSTRHFGTMAFHLTLERNIDDLLLDMIQRDLMDDAASLVKLYRILHHGSSLNATELAEVDGLDLVKAFVAREAKDRSRLELALQAYEDMKRQTKEIDASIHVAHGWRA